MNDALPNELLVISSYPPKGETHHQYIVGVASYTKNTLLAIKKLYPTTTIAVLAEKLPHIPNSYLDEDIFVKRVWKRNKLSIFPHLYQEITKHHSTTKHIVLEFEVAMFGGMLSLLPLPFFLLLLRIQRKHVSLVFHQVIVDLNNLHGHINLAKNSLKGKLITTCIHLFYRLLLRLATHVIVFDEQLKYDSARFGTKEKIFVIPHGVEKFHHHLTQHEAKEKLGYSQDTQLLLYFGFMAWYKGTDLLVDAFCNIPLDKRKEKKLSLIIAGGPNPNHVGKKFYDAYIESIKKKAQENDIAVTGFISEEDIPLYFQAADVVLLPYRTYMSASGPLSLCFSFHKPFLLSPILTPTLKTTDFAQTLTEEKVVYDEVLLSLYSVNDLLSHVTNRQLLASIQKVSKQMALKRDWDHIGRMYYERIFS